MTEILSLNEYSSLQVKSLQKKLIVHGIVPQSGNRNEFKKICNCSATAWPWLLFGTSRKVNATAKP
jgi:hypothetical protein